MYLLAGIKLTQVNFSGKMQDNLDSTENTSFCIQENMMETLQCIVCI